MTDPSNVRFGHEDAVLPVLTEGDNCVGNVIGSPPRTYDMYPYTLAPSHLSLSNFRRCRSNRDIQFTAPVVESHDIQ
jgi:hypothetical protein